MRPLSYTQIALYLACPLCYRLRYIDGLKPKAHSYFSFGSTLHLCAQYFFRVKVLPPPSLDKLLAYYEARWISSGYESIEEETSYSALGREILRRFWQLHSRNFSLPLAVEYPFCVDIGGVKVRGFIDRIDKLDGGGLSLIDYKSGQGMFTRETLEKDLQLSLYQLAVEKTWFLPVEKLTLYHLRSNTVCSCNARDSKRLAETEKLVLSTTENIAAGRFEASENSHCPCDFDAYCPYYRHKYQTATSGAEKEPTLGGMSVGEIVERYATLQSQLKELEIEAGELKRMISEYCQREEINRLYGERHAVTGQLVERAGFNEDEVRALLEPAGLWPRSVGLDQSRLKALINSGELPADLRLELEKLSRVVSTYWQLRVREIKPEEDGILPD
jgi:RecB family exonuclease